MRKNGMKRTWTLSIALLLILSVFLAACGGNSDSTSSSPAAATDASKTAAPAATEAPTPAAEDITLTYSSGFTGPDRPAYEELAKLFTSKHPNIKINMD